MEEYWGFFNWIQYQGCHCDLPYIIISFISHKSLTDTKSVYTFPIMDQRMDPFIHESESLLVNEITPM